MYIDLILNLFSLIFLKKNVLIIKSINNGDHTELKTDNFSVFPRT